MSNLISFPTTVGPSAVHVGAAFLAEPEPHSHAVQFYEDPTFLFDTVARFLSAGLQSGERVLVIACEAHRSGFAERTGHERFESAIASGQLTVLDAEATLAQFMIGDMPDPDLFRDVLSRELRKLRPPGHEQRRVRAYGEMVDLLWREGNSRAAIRLEELWNEAGRHHAFELLCAYVMGNFYKEGAAEQFMEVCRAHSHVMPSERFSALDDPHARLREISLLQQRARALESEITHRKRLEDALRDALRDRSRVEEELRDCVRREQDARAAAERSDRFKEVVLGILGHDLRNPLHTILTTARLMAVRGDLRPDNRVRVERMVASGARMQRMIDQLLDITRVRLGTGIPVIRSAQHDLALLVTRLVDEAREAHAGRVIVLDARAPVLAAIDPDRFEQVVSNFVGNALSHGDPTRPVEITVSLRGDLASFSVHNFGGSIDPAVLPKLFDPFRQGHEHHGGRSDGLGLGLYISERIVTAHGGRIEVESCAVRGTRFEALFPCGAA